MKNNTLLLLILSFLLAFTGRTQVNPCNVDLTYEIAGASTPPPPVPGPDYTMASGTISTCAGTFYDPGGPTGSYGNNDLVTQTFCSDIPGGQIIFDFTVWDLETCCDVLTIYDNSTASGTVLFSDDGSNSPGTVMSTNGCLTFVWDSDFSVTDIGWEATINCLPPVTFDCNGGDIVLTADGQGEYTLVLNNDFDGGTAGTGWNSNITADFSNPCDPSVDGGTYMWMGNSSAHPRVIETLPLDLSCGGEICFFLDFATQGNASPCEGIDEADEGVYLEYSTDGGTTWTTIEYYGPAGVGNSTNAGGTDPQMTSWNEYCLPIPPGAESPNTMFHWAQTGSSGNGNDHWGIDNVTISSQVNCVPYVYDYAHLPPNDDNPVQTETVTSTTTYTVTYTNGTDACTSSVTVVVPPGTNADAGPDQILCTGSGGVTIGGDPVCNDEGATYSWDNGAGSGTVDFTAPGTDNGQVTVNPAVTTTYTLTTTFNGCTETDQVTVTVDTPPTASNPAPINVECAADVPLPDITVVTDEADDSGAPTVTFVSDVSDGNTCPEVITRTYRITDDCANSIDVTQTITIDDVTNPVFAAAPANITVECVGDVPAAANLGWTDNCDGAGNVLSTDGPIVGGNCGGTITRTWTYTDNCGNPASATQTITIDDTQAPVFDAPPANITVECVGDVPAATNLNWTDNCDGTGSVLSTDGPIVGGNCGGTITRTWTYTDACGNPASATQTITIDDTQAPVFDAPPANITIECVGDVPAATNLNWTDNCDGTGSVLSTDGPIVGGNCGGTITRTWTYTDACGNPASATQIITIDDTQAPVFAAPPAALNVECAGDVPAPGNLGWTDNCDGAGTVLGTDVSDGGSCPEIITRTWTYTDACGNPATVTQTITINDVTAPTATNPAGTSITNTDPIPPVDPTIVTDENDNCTATPTVAFVSESSDGGSCPEIITRIYSVTDDCGNSINVTHTITIGDAVMPTATNPTPINVECAADVPATDPTVVTDEADNTGVPTVTWEDDVSDGNTCPEVITRRYRVTDDCGNFIFVSQTITIEDITNPVFDAPPAALNVECSTDVPAPGTLNWTDNCDGTGTVLGTDVSDGGSCPEIITRTWTYTDNCGNPAAVTQTITINDITPPTATNPAGVNISNTDPMPAVDPTVVTDEADNCTATPTVAFVSDVSDGNTCPEIVTRTYSVTDDCGNSITVTQTITIGDGVPPTATNPTPINVECAADVPATDPTVVTDEADNTGVPTVTWEDDVSDGNTCPEVITRRYRVTDDCGNFIFVSQTITIEDVTNPVFDAPPAALNVECSADVPAPSNLNWTDNCDGTGTVLGTDVSDGGSCPEIITRTWTYTDNCGNPATVTQTITINDITPPTATNPAGVSITNLDPVPPADPTVVTDEADNCTATPTVAFVSESSDGGACPEIITRIYSVTDDCGNSINVTHTITIGDAAAPTASNPVAINVECLADVPIADPAVVTDEADDSGAPTVTWEDDVSDGNTCPEVITRRYRVTDNCGNFIFVSQTITIEDVTNPVFAAPPADITVECVGDVPAAANLGWTDNCDGAGDVLSTDGPIVGGNCGGTITRTWTYTDNCGNPASVTQTITIDDTQNPVFDAPPAALNVECSADVPAPGNLGWTDNCDGTGTVLGTDVSDGLTCPETITRTWTYTDACGNPATVTQTITVEDVTNPVFDAPPADVTVECVGDVPAPSDLDWTDNCDGNGTVTSTDGPIVGGNCGGTITRTWTYTDACGNPATETQIITIDDTQNPVFNAPPAALNVECSADVPAPGNLAWTDNCDGTGTVLGTDVSDGLSCPETITRTWTYTDACGNPATVTQTITVNDVTNPTASNPATTTVPGGPAPAVDVNVVTDEADNCTAAPIVAFVSEVSDGNACPEEITRTYSVTDDCGNTINVTHTILITDPFPPTASNPAALNVECIGDVPAPDVTVVTDEADNSGIPTVAWEDDTSDGNTCPETITRRYRVTDDCGNFIFVSQSIIVEDITNPVFAAPPANITVECVGDVPAAANLGWTDNCDGAGDVLSTDGPIVGGNCGGTITRTWTYTDNCGNPSSVTQTITINDTQNPVFDAPPADVTVECVGDVPAPSDLDWTDNCDGNGTVTSTDGPIVGGNCGGTITRTWTYTDACGNPATETQIITINDTQNPVFAAPPANLTVECIGDVPAPGNLAWTDNCDGAGDVLGTDVSDGLSCPETITRTWTYTDACGNPATVTQTITVNDVTNPTASNPATTTVPGGPAPAVDVNVVTDEADNCTAAPIVAFVSEVSDGNSCPEEITRTYSVTDDCGNTINVTHTILITDPFPPTASNPVALNVECIGDVPAPDVTVVIDEADNQGVPVVAFVSDVSDGNSCPETITRTYSVTDVCGNQILVTQDIIVNDVTDPTASNPVTVNVECIGDVPAADISVVTDEADNCTAVPTVAFVNDVSDGLSCPETITRTYSVTDDCGNTLNVTQLIIVNDVTNPTASNPADISVAGANDVPAPNINDVIDEADNCTASPVVAWVSDVSDGNVCNNEKITRTYSVTDDCGNSITVTQQITILATPAPIDAGPDVTICIGENVTLTADNPWNAIIDWTPPVVDGVPFTPGSTATYTVTADNLGCISTDDVTVTVEDLPATSFFGDVLSGCVPSTTLFTSTTPGNIVSSVWSVNGQVIGDAPAMSNSWDTPGLYDVTLTTTSATGCVNTVTYSDYIYIEADPIASFSASSNEINNIDSEVHFNNTSQGASSYLWYFGDNSAYSSDVSPSHTYPNEEANSFTVELVAYSPLGCTDTAYTVIKLTEELIYYVPNTFTPDNDDYNETFLPVFSSGYDAYDYTLYIFDRWGEIIFESNNASVGWDGTYGGQIVKDGVYLWKIEFKTTANDERKVATGHVNLLR